MKFPFDWDRQLIGSLCESIVPGRNKPKKFDGAIPWVTTPEINGRYVPSVLQKNYVSEVDLKEAGGKIVPKGAVVIAAVGDLGLVAITTEKVVLNQQLHAFVCLEKINNEYLAYWLETQKAFMESVASKTTIPYMNKANCESIPVYFPLLPEQQKIAKILSTWDKAISTTEQLLANSQQQKKALTQQLLTGELRLLADDGVRFSGEWKATAISKFIKESRVTGSNGDLAKKITVKLYGNGVVAKDEKRVGSESTKYYRRSAGQFIYSKLDFLNGAFGIIPTHLDGYESTLDLPAFDFLDGVCVKWFIYFVSREDFYTANMGLANGGRKARRVNPSDLLKIRIPTPSLDEQQKIAAVLSAADQEISTLKQQLATLKQEKKALMQQLLTGKVRVKVEHVA